MRWSEIAGEINSERRRTAQRSKLPRHIFGGMWLANAVVYLIGLLNDMHSLANFGAFDFCWG